MWIDAQAVYKACYDLIYVKSQEKKQLWRFYVEKTMREEKKFRWRKFRKTNLTRKEAESLLKTTRYGDHYRREINGKNETKDVLFSQIDLCLEAVKILTDGKCFINPDVYSVVEPYLKGQERIEDDSRSD